ncbi:integrase, catalytic region, zinc finger, CCHC-type containing protein [Tanacetum coccineum]
MCCTTPASRYEVGEGSAAAATRLIGPAIAREDPYRFVDMVDAAIGDPMSRESDDGITDTWDDLVGTIQDIAPTTLEGVNRRVTELSTTFDQETKILYGMMEDAQDDRTLLRGRVNILFRDRLFHHHTSVLMEQEARLSRAAWAQSMARTTEREAADRRRQEQLVQTLTLLKSCQTQLTAALRRIDTLEARGPAPPEAPKEAGLGHNLFSVGQFCDGDLEVAFCSKTSYVQNLEGDNLLTGDRESNLYTIPISDMAASSPVCLMSKATLTKSWLWHRRLSHLNFGTINDLTRLDLVDGLPKFKYGKDHLCSACERGKSKKASYPLKLVPSDHSKLELLHMDLCGPMRVASINGKKMSRDAIVIHRLSKDESEILSLQHEMSIEECSTEESRCYRYTLDVQRRSRDAIVVHEMFIKGSRCYMRWSTDESRCYCYTLDGQQMSRDAIVLHEMFSGGVEMLSL